MKIQKVKPRFNHKMLTVARESRGLTQKELADLLDIDQGNLSRMEHGLLEPPKELMSNISKRLEYPLNFFKQQREVHDLSVNYFRKKLQAPKKEIIKSEAEINISRFHVEELLKLVEIPDPNYPRFDERKSPAECARYVRQFWKLPKGRLVNLTRLLEDNGILVVGMDFSGSEIDGVPVVSADNTPVIFINNNIPADRYRLTLAHELGHLAMHVGSTINPGRDVEEEAYLFGAELLMPENEISPQLESGKLTIEKLADLKRYWHVSMAAILKRAMVLDIVTVNQYQYLWKQMVKLGYKLREPEELDFPKDQPSMFRELIDTHLNALMCTEADLAEMLCLSHADLSRRYLPFRTRLKVTRSSNN